MKYDDFWKGLQAVFPDVDVDNVKKLCYGMVDVFADNYMKGVLKPREFLLGISIAVVPTLDIINADREKALGVLCELLHAVSESVPKQETKRTDNK